MLTSLEIRFHSNEMYFMYPGLLQRKESMVSLVIHRLVTNV